MVRGCKSNRGPTGTTMSKEEEAARDNLADARARASRADALVERAKRLRKAGVPWETALAAAEAHAERAHADVADALRALEQ